MASASLFSSLRARKLPSSEEFIAPENLTSSEIIHIFAEISSQLVQRFSDRVFTFQRKNSRSLIRKIELLIPMFETLRDFRGRISPTVNLCLKEFCSVIHRSKMLLDYCSESSRLMILLQNQTISSRFHDIDKEIGNLLDVLPFKRFNLDVDVIEQIELLQTQSGRTKLFVDENDEELRSKLFRILSSNKVPEKEELESIFVKGVRIRDEEDCVAEIELLEETMKKNEDFEVAPSILEGLAATLLYCKFLIFQTKEEFEERKLGLGFHPEDPEGSISTIIPKDFCCPISLELMRDPVTISTGQTYDRRSITRWIEAGHHTCPKTGQIFVENHLLPNRAIRSLISDWCKANSIDYDNDRIEFARGHVTSSSAREANKASIDLLMEKLSAGSASAAREIRLLAKKGGENRAYIAKAGAIHHLKKLLPSSDSSIQENSVTAILNLSIYEKNKTLIMEEGCLRAIVDVLRSGGTIEARENAAATLFSLSSVHEYKRAIGEEDGAVECLVELLQSGTSRGRKDAVTALFNLSTHSENCSRMIDGGAVRALVRGLGYEGVSEEAAAALAVLVRRQAAAEAVGKEEMAVAGLVRVMQCGSPKGKENAVAVLLELCRIGGDDVRERIFRVPALASLLQTLLFTGTKRARRKAASLARFSREVKI